MDAEHYTYFAFISYSRKDSRVARWLQRRLDADVAKADVALASEARHE